MSSYWEHCSCYRDSGAQDSREPLAAAGLAVLGSVARRAIDAAAADLKGGVTDNEPGPGIVLAGTGVESRDAAGGADVDVGPRAAGGVEDDGSAVASLAPGGGDARGARRSASAATRNANNKDKTRSEN